MKSVLRFWPSVTNCLRPFHKTLWLFDYDGTLTRIKPRPEWVKTDPHIRELLIKVARRFPNHVGIISGRSVRQLRQKINIPGLMYGGTHGFEIEGPKVHFRKTLPAARQQSFRRLLVRIRRSVSRIPGLWLEDKKETACVHYRLARRQDAARVHSALNEIRQDARQAGFGVQEALKDLEILSNPGWNKGEAVLWLMRRKKARRVFFAGDDVTDEAVFRALGSSHVTVSVGLKKASKAAFFLRHQGEVGKLLGRIIKL